jgi:hypothetical protein
MKELTTKVKGIISVASRTRRENLHNPSCFRKHVALDECYDHLTGIFGIIQQYSASTWMALLGNQILCQKVMLQFKVDTGKGQPATLYSHLDKFVLPNVRKNSKVEDFLPLRALLVWPSISC